MKSSLTLFFIVLWFGINTSYSQTSPTGFLQSYDATVVLKSGEKNEFRAVAHGYNSTVVKCKNAKVLKLEDDYDYMIIPDVDMKGKKISVYVYGVMNNGKLSPQLLMREFWVK